MYPVGGFTNVAPVVPQCLPEVGKGLRLWEFIFGDLKEL